METELKTVPHAITTQLHAADMADKANDRRTEARVIIHHLGHNAHDRTGYKKIVEFLTHREESRAKALLKFILKTNQAFDCYQAVIYYHDENVIFRRTVEEAYKDAGDADDARPTFIRIWKINGFSNYICAPNTAYFGGIETDLYDDTGHLKQSVKDTAIDLIKTELLFDDPIFAAANSIKLWNDQPTEKDHKARLFIEMFFAMYRQNGAEILKRVIKGSGYDNEFFEIYVYMDLQNTVFFKTAELALIEAINNNHYSPNFIWLCKMEGTVYVSGAIKVRLWNEHEKPQWFDSGGAINTELQAAALQKIKSSLNILTI